MADITKQPVSQQPGNVGYSSQSEQVVVQNPVLVQVQVPQPIPNCPPGLEYLAQIDQLIIKQKKELCEIFTGCEMQNKYHVYNTLGQQIYFVQEDTDFCTRQCCGPLRPFDIQVVDNFQREVIRLIRPLRCQGCCCPCCLQEMEIHAPPGQVIGYVKERWTCCYPKWDLFNANHDLILTIGGPLCQCKCCGDVVYNVMSSDETNQVGKITKQWMGLMELFTDADNFSVTFPVDMDVSAKAIVFGAAFLIDFMYFEQSDN